MRAASGNRTNVVRHGRSVFDSTLCCSSSKGEKLRSIRLIDAFVHLIVSPLLFIRSLQELYYELAYIPDELVRI